MIKGLLFFLAIFSTGLSAQTVDSVQYVLGRFSPAEHPQFIEIPIAHASRGGMYVRREALTAFLKMKEAAKVHGIELRIISAARNFYAQKSIWEAKWNGARKVGGKNLTDAIPEPKPRALEILKYSSMPGTSRHHWGSDIDINSVNPPYFESGKGKVEYEWLRDNAYHFGFCQVYSVKDSDRPSGYEEEKWHWSYIPIASKLTKFYRENVSNTDIKGFNGSDALSFEEVSNYVFGIAPECR